MNKTLLDDIYKMYSPISCEKNLCNFIIEEIKNFVSSYEVDYMGNLTARIKGDGPKIMILSNMDQEALMVTYCHKQNKYSFVCVGEIEDLEGKKIVFMNNETGTIKLNENERPLVENMYIEMDKENAIINIGDVCNIFTKTSFKENYYTTNLINNRISCYVLVEIIKKLKNVKTNYDCYFTFSAQKIVDGRGEIILASKIEPDFSIAINNDIFSSINDNLDSIPGLIIKDGEFLTNQKINEIIINTANNNNIPYKVFLLNKERTTAGKISVLESGICSGACCIEYSRISNDNYIYNLESIENLINLITCVLV